MHDQQSIASINNMTISAALYGAVLFITALFPAAVTAEIYKWVDGQGKIHFTDSPPEQASVKQIKLQINSFSSPSVSTFEFDSSLISTRKISKKVIMYGANWCGYCKKAKRYFVKNSIPYVEYDVETSTKGRKDFKALGGKGVPVILVGNQRLNGFSESSFEKIYQR
ncbi:MAG: glutaredoxin family protein [Proteobacteria bacterium]|nr:glutaredoxin family protein [Pseudomonadota bacterium]